MDDVPFRGGGMPATATDFFGSKLLVRDNRGRPPPPHRRRGKRSKMAILGTSKLFGQVLSLALAALIYCRSTSIGK